MNKIDNSEYKMYCVSKRERENTNAGDVFLQHIYENKYIFYNLKL